MLMYLVKALFVGLVLLLVLQSGPHRRAEDVGDWMFIDRSRTRDAFLSNGFGGSGGVQEPVEHEPDQSEDLVDSDRDGMSDAIFNPKSRILYEEYIGTL